MLQRYLPSVSLYLAVTHFTASRCLHSIHLHDLSIYSCTEWPLTALKTNCRQAYVPAALQISNSASVFVGTQAVRIQVLTAASIKMRVFWDIGPVVSL
jgi:hypothetical protein